MEINFVRRRVGRTDAFLYLKPAHVSCMDGTRSDSGPYLMTRNLTV